MITRRQWLASAAFSAATPSRPPNVLLLLTDQHYIDALSATGNRYVKTPNIDRIAREGTRFRNSWCTSPVCSPARSSLITGCMPHRTQVECNGDRLNKDVPTIGEIFRTAGYETAWAGKWHLPAAYPGAQIPGEPPPLAGDRGFDFVTFPLANKRMLAFGDDTDAPIVRAAAEFVRKKRSKPFLLGVSIHNPHDICYWIMNRLPPDHPSAGPVDVPERDLPPLPDNFQRPAEEPEFIARCRMRGYYGDEIRFTKDWDELRWRQYLYAYYRMTERADRNIGVVLDALREANLEDNTVVVFSADHGEGMAAHHWVVKLMLYQEPLSVPLVFRWKGHVPANQVNNTALASGMDLLPTLCDMAGVRLLQPVHGTSLRSALQRSNPGRDSVFAQLAPEIKDRRMQGRAVRSARYKYVAFSWGRNPEMLFDLKADPGELHNLVASAAAKPELERHRALLGRWVKETGDPFAQ